MRITGEERAAIGAACREVFGPDATVRLFGSRVRDDARGGDIDLFVEADPARATLANEIRLERLLHDAIGERRIDIVVHARGKPLPPIGEIAMQRGVEL